MEYVDRVTIDRIAELLRSDGINNPITAVEQTLYVAIVISVSRKGPFASKAKGIAKIREPMVRAWSNPNDQEFARVIRDEVYPRLSRLLECIPAFGSGQSFELKLRNAGLIRRVMNEMKSVCSEDADADMLGDVVEHLMTPLRQSSRFGQFRTPAHVRHLMVQLIAPQPAEHILDPCCGTGSLLLDAYRFATRVETSRRSGGIACRGVDVSGEMCRIAVANSVLVASGKLEIANSDALGPPCNSLRKNYDVILSNPPFASQSGSTLGQSHSRNRLSAMAFVDLMMNRLGRHGRCATVVPAGLLTSMSPKCVSVRERLISEFELLAVIGLPVSTFTPYANVSTAIIVFRRPASLRSKRSATLMCQLNRDGFARGGVVRRGRRRTPTPSDIPTLLERWSKYRKSDYCDHSIFTDDLPETLPWRIVSATDLHRDNLSLLPSQWLAPLTPNDLHTSYADALEVVLQEYAGVGHELAALRRQLRRSRK